MKVLLQRVTAASCVVDGRTTGSIDQGLLLFVGLHRDDSEDVLEWMASKISGLRVFPDERGRFHFSVAEASGALLAIPQFTLFADTTKGRRPEFFEAAPPEKASPYFERFTELLRRESSVPVETGVFGAHMHITAENDGPVSMLIER